MNKKKQGKQIDSIVNNIDKALEASGQFKGVTGKVKKKLYESGGKKVLKLAIKSQIGIFLMNCFLFKFILIGVMMVFLMLAAAGIVQFFEQDNKTLEDMNINWDDYQCTCIHLTPEEIVKVKAGGQVEVDGSNGSGINISGGSVTTGAHGLAKTKTLGSIISVEGNSYGFPFYDGYTREKSGSDVVVHLAADNRVEPTIWRRDKNLLGVPDTKTVAERAADNVVTYEYLRDSLAIEDGRLLVALASGDMAWPDDPDHSNTMLHKDIDIVFKDGTVLPCRTKDMKANKHTGTLHMFYAGGTADNANADYSFIELYNGNGSMQQWLKTYGRGLGGIDHMVTYEHKDVSYAVQQGAYDFSSISNITNDTTASFGQTGTGTTQSNSGNSGLSTNTSTDYDLNSFSIANSANLMVVVEGTGGSNCAVKAFEKSGSIWEERVNTIGVLGANGMSANRTEGDKTTPIGVFKMNTPFGQADALDGFPSDYFKVDKHDYWSDETDTYNKHVRDETRVVSGEAIGTDGFAEIYDYVIDSGYNVGGIEKKGSALFLHCTKANKVSTAGCVAIPKDDMETIMKLFAKYENNSYIIQGIKGSVKDLYNAYNDDGLSPSSSSGTTNGSTGGSGTNGVQQNTLKYSNGEKISLDSSWEYASYSKINSGAATYYVSTAQTKKNICITVNAGHGCSGGDSVKTQSHPDGTGKYTSGTTAQGEKTSIAISSGMTFKDNTLERTANLNVALKLKDKLLENGYDVLMIRESDDEQLDNIARTVISNNVSDAHIAIHFDSTDNDKGAFYMKVVDVEAYKNMSPVKEHWQEHDALGESLLNGLSNAGVGLWSTRALDSDLTQTSYSVIPSIDIELGDRGTTLTDELYTKYAEGLALGVEEFFKTHTPSNQAKRGISNISNESGNNSGTTNGGTVNKNLNNLRTKCMMKEEGICGCYISDPSCMCHVLAGEDGVIGTEDDGKISTDENEEQNNISGLTAEQSQVINAAREVMQTYLETLKVKYPSYYEAGWTSTTSPTFGLKDCGPWYGYASGYHEPIINGISYNEARWDCSSYVNGVLIRLGAPWAKVSNSTSTMLGKNFRDSVIADDRFILLKYDINILQPGDIVLKNKHTEILYKMIDVNTSTVSRYGWGSTGAVRTAYDATTRTLLNEPTTLSYSYYNNGARADEYIIRYVGSGGAGK